MADLYMSKDLPTLWVCLHCGKWHEDRYQLRDVSCFLNAREFKRDEIVFSRDNPNTIVEINVRTDNDGPDVQV